MLRAMLAEVIELRHRFPTIVGNVD